MSRSSEVGRPAEPDTLWADVGDGGIFINFSEHYGMRELKTLDFVPMNRKRNYLSMAPKCVEALRRLFEDRVFALGYLTLRVDLTVSPDDAEPMGYEAMAERVADIFSPEIVAAIYAQVEAEYALNEIDISCALPSSTNRLKNEELQITNDHAMTILAWSYGCVVAIPLIVAYLAERDCQSKETAYVIMECFGQILGRFEPEGVNILAKLHKLVESRVLQTRYSDRVIWAYMINVAIEPGIFVERLFRRFVIDAIPKLRQGTRLVGFFQAFLKNQLRYQFMAKYALTYRQIRPDVIDGSLPAMEFLETELIRDDEAGAIISDVACAQAVQHVTKQLKWSPSDAEIEHWMGTLLRNGVNDWQKELVSRFYLPLISQAQVIKTRTLREYTEMYLLLARWLEVNSFHALRAYLLAQIVENDSGKRIYAKRKFVSDFMMSAHYTQALTMHYEHTVQAIIDSDAIIGSLGILYSGKFVSLPRSPAENDLPREEVSYRIETVAQEYLRVMSHAMIPN